MIVKKDIRGIGLISDGNGIERVYIFEGEV